jgi:hypothetical protein
VSEAPHVPYQRDNRARWIITADLGGSTKACDPWLCALFGVRRGLARINQTARYRGRRTPMWTAMS